MPSAHLLIIGDRAALSWVVTEQRMAFPAGRAKVAHALGEGDEVFVYTTCGCFRNPTRDLGRVIGRATIVSPVRVLDEPVVFNERSYSEGCRLKVSGLARSVRGWSCAIWCRGCRSSLTRRPGVSACVERR